MSHYAACCQRWEKNHEKFRNFSSSSINSSKKNLITDLTLTGMDLLAVNGNVFENVNKSTCKLYVPKGSYSSYWVANVRGDFTNIIEEDVTAITPSYIDAISVTSETNGHSTKTIVE